jgi:hypothetical protein
MCCCYQKQHTSIMYGRIPQHPACKTLYMQVLKEQARRYKHRLQDTERHANVLEQQLLAAQASNSKLKAQLQDGDTAGQSAVELAQARQQAEGLSRALEVSHHASCTSHASLAGLVFWAEALSAHAPVQVIDASTVFVYAVHQYEASTWSVI